MSADGEQSLMAHLLELRRRLLYAVLAVIAVFVMLLPFANNLYAWLAEPLRETLPKGSQLVAIEVASTFFVPMKLAFFFFFFFSTPYIFYQIWAFVAPALYEKEKKHGTKTKLDEEATFGEYVRTSVLQKISFFYFV